MKKLLLCILLILSFKSGRILSRDSNHQIIRPFGFPSRQPPTSAAIKIIDFKIGLEAQQVCGYTDWTTASLTLPKHLLSKQYWSKVGQKIVNQAKKTILDISGALPSMLACNVSPSWCNVLNKAQMLAAFESQLTFDTCKMLDGVANSDHLQATQLKNCIKRNTSTNPNITAGQAREMCLVNPDVSDGATSKKDKIAKTAKGSRSSFNMADLLRDLFPERVTTRTGQTIPLDSGGKTYSRRNATLELTKRLFPGLEISGTATVVAGGTFQPTVEEEIAREMNELEEAVVEVMKEMLRLRDLGHGPNEIIQKTSFLWKNKNKWKKNKKPHPFYRSTSDGTPPSFLITPEQVLILLPLADRSKSDLMTNELKQVIDRIGRSVATIKLADNFSDLYNRSLDVCKKSPKYQEALAQKNCDLIIERTKASIQILHYTRENEERARLAQVEVANLIDGIQRDKVKRSRSPLIEGTRLNESKLKMPWE